MAALQRCPPDQFPELHQLTGETPPQPSEEEVAAANLAAIRSWNSVFRARAALDAKKNQTEKEPQP